MELKGGKGPASSRVGVQRETQNLIAALDLKGLGGTLVRVSLGLRKKEFLFLLDGDVRAHRLLWGNPGFLWGLSIRF